MMHRTYITTGERIRNYLSVAVLFSLLINAATTLVMPDLTRYREDEPPPATITIDHHIRTIVRTPPPSPPPTPAPRRPVKPVSKPFAAAIPHLRAISHTGPVQPPYVVPKTGSSGGSGPDTIGTQGSAVSAAPVTPAAACSNPNQEASVTNAIAPDYPDSARAMGYGPVSVLVQVTLDANGTLVDAKIAQSSGSAAFDQAALRAARESSYAPRIADCEAATGTYIFRADFTP